MHVDETVFTVHINPYFLRLNFSNPLLEDDASSAQYDPSSGYLTVTLTKENKGQEFQDLDLLAKLLAPRPSAQAPVIEVISTTPSASGDDELAARTESLSLDREQEEILKGTTPASSLVKVSTSYSGSKRLAATPGGPWIIASIEHLCTDAIWFLGHVLRLL